VPVVVIGTSGTAGMIRRLRANLLDELQKQYVVTARAKGLSPRRVLLKYPLRVSLNPFVADIGSLLPELISGAVIVSAVLSLPTTGPMLLDALRSQDMYLAGSFLMFLALLTVIGIFISDLLLAVLDPRIRFGAVSAK
jgi:peptide/nickel transport system permease protein